MIMSREEILKKRTEKVNWFYIRKEHGRLGSILTVGEAIKAEG